MSDRRRQMILHKNMRRRQLARPTDAMLGFAGIGGIPIASVSAGVDIPYVPGGVALPGTGGRDYWLRSTVALLEGQATLTRSQNGKVYNNRAVGALVPWKIDRFMDNESFTLNLAVAGQLEFGIRGSTGVFYPILRGVWT